jgi:hypothetical protein
MISFVVERVFLIIDFMEGGDERGDEFSRYRILAASNK